MWGTPKSVNKIFRTLVLLWTFETIQHIYFYLSYHLPWLISMHPLWEYCICRYLYTALLKSILCSSSTRSILIPTEKKKSLYHQLPLLCLYHVCARGYLSSCLTLQIPFCHGLQLMPWSIHISRTMFCWPTSPTIRSLVHSTFAAPPSHLLKWFHAAIL